MATIRVGLAQLERHRRRPRRATPTRCWRRCARARTRAATSSSPPSSPSSGYPPEDLLLKEGFVDGRGRRAREARRGLAAVPRGRRHRRARGRRASSRSPDPSTPATSAGRPRGPAPRLANAAALVGPVGCSGRWRSGGSPTTRSSTSSAGSRRATGTPRVSSVAGAGVGVARLRGRLGGRRPGAWSSPRAARGSLVVLNASPYSRARLSERLDGAVGAAPPRPGAPIAYVNLVGGQDELVFDGASFVLGRDGEVLAAAPAVRRGTCSSSTSSVHDAPRRRRCSRGARRGPRTRGRELATAPSPSRSPDVDEVYEALVARHARLPARRTGSRSAVRRAVGRHRLVARRHRRRRRARAGQRCSACRCRRGTARRTRASDARELAERLGIRFVTIADRAGARRARRGARPVLGGEPTGLTDENLQSRIRGVAPDGDLERDRCASCSRPGNKSELATGYSTLYGDSRRRLRGHQGRRQDARLRAVPVPQRARGGARGARADPRVGARPSRRRPSCAPTSCDADSLPPYERARPGARGLRRGGPHRRRARRARATTARSWSASPRSSTPRSTSAARCRPACASRSKSFGRDRRMPDHQPLRARRRRERPALAGRRRVDRGALPRPRARSSRGAAVRAPRDGRRRRAALVLDLARGAVRLARRAALRPPARRARGATAAALVARALGADGALGELDELARDGARRACARARARRGAAAARGVGLDARARRRAARRPAREGAHPARPRPRATPSWRSSAAAESALVARPAPSRSRLGACATFERTLVAAGVVVGRRRVVTSTRRRG